MAKVGRRIKKEGCRGSNKEGRSSKEGRGGKKEEGRCRDKEKTKRKRGSEVNRIADRPTNY